MLLLSLIGEQPVPNLLPIRALQPEQTLLVYTERTEGVALRLRRILAQSPNLASRPDLSADLSVSAYNLERILNTLRSTLAGRSDVVYNLTGGTKIMALAAGA